MKLISDLLSRNKSSSAVESDDSDEESAQTQMNYFFIRGYMKSGTNWLGNILNLHPEVHIRGEFHFHTIQAQFERMVKARHLYKGKNHELIEKLNVDAFEDSVRTIMSGYMEQEGVTWVGDRTPELAWPLTLRDARYLYITRDPRDVVVSRAYHFMNKPDLEAHKEYISSEAVAPHFSKFSENPDYFRENPQHLLTSESFIRRTFAGWLRSKESEARAISEAIAPIFSVRYEDLHSDVEAVRGNIYSFLDLDPSLASDLGHKTQPGFSKEVANQFYRKGQVGDWANYWNPLADSVAKEVLGKDLERFGYQWG